MKQRMFQESKRDHQCFFLTSRQSGYFPFLVTNLLEYKQNSPLQPNTRLLELQTSDR
ncbi:hypothetical protein Hanom_Chr12g01070731 [Helianthus anomalus]